MNIKDHTTERGEKFAKLLDEFRELPKERRVALLLLLMSCKDIKTRKG